MGESSLSLEWISYLADLPIACLLSCHFSTLALPPFFCSTPVSFILYKIYNSSLTWTWVHFSIPQDSTFAFPCLEFAVLFDSILLETMSHLGGLLPNAKAH